MVSGRVLGGSAGDQVRVWSVHSLLARLLTTAAGCRRPLQIDGGQCLSGQRLDSTSLSGRSPLVRCGAKDLEKVWWDRVRSCRGGGGAGRAWLGSGIWSCKGLEGTARVWLASGSGLVRASQGLVGVWRALLGSGKIWKGSGRIWKGGLVRV